MYLHVLVCLPVFPCVVRLYVHSVFFVCLAVCLFVCSSDSCDSHLPIIRRGEGSTEETYDESYVEDRVYHEDDHSLSSDM